MSPHALISIDTSEDRAPPNPKDASIKSKTCSLHPSSTDNNGAQGPESSNSSGPPSYVRNTPPDNPFRDGDAHMGYFYPNSNGVQKGLKLATATHGDPPPAAMATLDDPLPPVPSADVDPFDVELVLDESLLSRPPLPSRPPGLKRGLQIPSRASHITWGFSFPKVLTEHGVTKPHWKVFKHEVKAFAKLSLGQWVTTLACSQAVSLLFGHIAGILCHHKMQKHKEHENFILAYESGAMKVLEDRWNKYYFHPLGLHVRIEPPGVGKMNGMDVASSKLFRYQQKMGTFSPAPGVASKQGDKKEYKYQAREGRYRMKAARKGRIVVVPYHSVKPMPSKPRMTNSESHHGQSLGTTVMARPSVQDFAFLDQRQSGSEGRYRTPTTPTTAQCIASSRQRQASSEGLYRGRSETDAERAPSPAQAPTTHHVGNR